MVAVAAVLAALAPSASLVPAPLASGAEAVAAAPVDGAAGIGDPYWPLDGNGGIDVTSYRIVNRYAFDTGRLSGRTTVRLRATQDLASFSLDFLLPVRSVAVDGRELTTVVPEEKSALIAPLATESDTLGAVPVAGIQAAQHEAALLLRRLAAEGAIRFEELAA